MAYVEAPSFSLGIDFQTQNDESEFLDTNVEEKPFNGQNHETLAPSFELLREEERDEETPVPVFNRLKRGPSSPKKSGSRSDGDRFEGTVDIDDDEIEEFSSPEDRRKARRCSLNSSSKLSLSNLSVLTTQSASVSNVRKNSTPSTAFPSSIDGAKGVHNLRKASPIRKIELLDTDSEGSSTSGDCEFTHQINKPGQNKQQKNTVPDGLWKDISSSGNRNLETPVLNQFLHEYFQNGGNKSTMPVNKGDTRTGGSRAHLPSDFASRRVSNQETSECHEGYGRGAFHDDVPPSHLYFYHKDPRIKALVCGRLSNFRPLGYGDYGEGEQPKEGNINYMSQFGSGENQPQGNVMSQTGSQKRSRQPNRNSRVQKDASQAPSSSRKSSKRRKTREEKSQGASSSRKSSKGRHPPVETSQESSRWVNPKSSVRIPRDAGKRRVCAESHSAGHWYTGPNGKKVYVNKNGEELTGRIAYRNYRKENGMGFKKKKSSKKKTK